MIRNSDVLPDSDTNSSSTDLTSDEKLVDIRPSQIYMFSFKEAWWQKNPSSDLPVTFKQDLFGHKLLGSKENIHVF